MKLTKSKPEHTTKTNQTGYMQRPEFGP